MVRIEGTRQVRRPVQHYSLDAILAVGFRVRSHRGTQFRKWRLTCGGIGAAYALAIALGISAAG